MRALLTMSGYAVPVDEGKAEEDAEGPPLASLPERRWLVDPFECCSPWTNLRSFLAVWLGI